LTVTDFLLLRRFVRFFFSLCSLAGLVGQQEAREELERVLRPLLHQRAQALGESKSEEVRRGDGEKPAE
jgi:hypothetical protein